MPLDIAKIAVVDSGCSRQALWRRRMALEARIGRHRYKDPFKDSPRVVFFRWALRMIGLYEKGMRNALQPVLQEVSLSFAALPKVFDGFRILLLSDFHFRARPGFAEMVSRVVDGVEADLCVMGGDFRFNNVAPSAFVYEALAKITPRIRATHGIVAILGNNDTGEFVEGFKALGIQVLWNANRSIVVDGAQVWVVGVDDPHDYGCDSLALALNGIPEGAFTVLLAHSPEIRQEAAWCGVDAYLCGHTHGGQVCLPWYGPIIRNTRCRDRHMAGVWEEQAMRGYTVRGLGTSTLPVRFNCPPEAALLTLRAE